MTDEDAVTTESYTTYAGMKLKGKVVYDNGESKVAKGYEKFIARRPIDTAAEV